MVYHTSNEEHSIDIVNIALLEHQVKARMETGAFGYIYGGAEDEITMRDNTLSFNRKKIVPRVLQGIDSADLTTNLWDISLKTPIIQAPSAAHGLAHNKGEVDTAKGVAAAGSIFSISTYANTTIEDAAAAAPNAPYFFNYI